jgi:hypothetical protein
MVFNFTSATMFNNFSSFGFRFLPKFFFYFGNSCLCVGSGYFDDDEEIRKAWNDARRSRKGDLSSSVIERLRAEINRTHIKIKEYEYTVKGRKKELCKIKETVKEHPLDIVRLLNCINNLDPDFRDILLSKMKTIDVTYNYVVDDSEYSGGETPQWTGEIPQGN